MSKETDLLAPLIGESPERDDVVVPNGDDAAVVRIGDRLMSVSVDAVVEGVHFSLDYFSLRQVGIKAVEAAASDIVAIGTVPEHLLLTYCVPPGFSNGQVEELFGGCREAARRLGCSILGGDTTRTDGPLMVNVTVFGSFPPGGRPLERRGARAGDLVFVSGPLGGSAAGLDLLLGKVPGFDAVKQLHLEPRCHPELAPLLSRSASAAIDVSDGLSTEANHLANRSSCAVVIEGALVPIDPQVAEVAARFGKAPLEYAMNGGEDYQILFTVPPDRAEEVMKSGVVRIGRVEAGTGAVVETERGRSPLVARGYDHFGD